MHKYLLPTGVILVGLGLLAYAQTVTTPSSTAMVCAFNTTRASGLSGQFLYVQCDTEGRLIIAP